MRGDFSKLRFRPQKHYTSVLQQQGRVALDADANEQCAINDYLRMTETVDVVGVVGGPVHDEGFKITVHDGAIRIGKGRYYVDGILCENEHRLSYSHQPFLVDPDPTDQTLLGELQGSSTQAPSINVIQVYLQVWQRLVTALDDPGLREPALGMADTTARLQTVWRVVAKGVMQAKPKAITGTVAVSQNEATVIGKGTAFLTDLKAGQQIVFASDVNQIPYEIRSIASDTNLALATNLTAKAAPATTVSVVQPDGGCCKSMHLGVMPAPNQGKLSAQTSGDSSDCSCQPTPAAGYRGLENQLYRVEIHQHGDESTATFKWSRENGSIVVAITDTPASNVVSVDSLGLDANLGFSVGDWVEITDDTHEFGEPPNKPGNLCRIQSITGLSVTLQQSVSVDLTQNPRMRRWDQFGSSATANGVSLSTALVPLENGIEVEFTQGQYASGDYWLIPARTATGEIEWPPSDSDGDVFLPPHRIEVFSAPLACIQWDTQKGKAVVQDCRKRFYPLTELTPTLSSSCCTYRVGDGVNTFGDFTSIQKAIDSLPNEGGEVCILPGLYYENVRILNRRDIVIHGCGWQTRVASRSLKAAGTAVADQEAASDTAGAINTIAAVFTIAASHHVELRSFAVEAAEDEAGILIDGTGTSLSTKRLAELRLAAERLRGVIDITLQDMVLTAATLPAVLAVRAELLRIDRNRVVMKNVRSLWPAIYASGTEIHIDRNWVGIQSATTAGEWLPATVTDDLSGATTDNTAASAPRVAAASPVSEAVAGIDTADEETVAAREFVDSSDLTLVTVTTVATRPGGIQIGGPSTDVYILENEIEGGSLNGITLGSFELLDAKGKNTYQWSGVLVTDEGGECGTGTLQTSGNNSNQPGGKVVAGGILTNIQIHRNRIRNMGLCGIGAVGFFDLSETLEVITIAGLNISANAISRTVLRNLASLTKSQSAFVGYGAISISDVQNLIVCDNTITDFGVQPGSGVCGIFVMHGEMLEISRNQVIETRDWTKATTEKQTSVSLTRGGIVVLSATPPTFPQPLDNSQWSSADSPLVANNLISAPIYEPGLPAVRVEHNVVRVPLGHALLIRGLGPFTIVNNHLACGGLVSTGGTQLAQTVLIENFGTAIEDSESFRLPSEAYLSYLQTDDYVASEDVQRGSCGTVLFSNNLCQLEAAASGLREYASVMIHAADHLIFSNNHCWIDASPKSKLFVDAMLFGRSLNVIGNRFQEAREALKFSGITSGRYNITGENISTYCLIVLGASHLDNNNLSLYGTRATCKRFWKEEGQ